MSVKSKPEHREVTSQLLLGVGGREEKLSLDPGSSLESAAASRVTLASSLLHRDIAVV